MSRSVIIRRVVASKRAWPVLDRLDFIADGDPDSLSFHLDARSAVADAGFVGV